MSTPDTDQPSPGSATQLNNASIYLARYGVWVVLAGLLVILVSFGISVLAFKHTAADVSTALAPVTGIVGTIVGAYFGVQVGAQGRQQAEASTARAQEQVVRLAAAADPDKLGKLLDDGASGESDTPGPQPA